ncbi:MAG: PD40 domain-containing protein [Anaerolineales bacterium]|nr:PD40 domain-containing protein [Anaerolineales bacterium]
MDRFSPISPDGRQALFASAQDGDSEIFIMDSDGSHQRQLTYNEAWDGQPVWSEDGRQIYFASDLEGAIAFYAITDGAGVVKLLDACS